jgi:hypothetical protein
MKQMVVLSEKELVEKVRGMRYACKKYIAHKDTIYWEEDGCYFMAYCEDPDRPPSIMAMPAEGLIAEQPIDIVRLFNDGEYLDTLDPED